MRTAEIIRAENDYLEKKTALAFKKAVKAAENPVSLDSGDFGRLDTALQRRLVRSIFQAVCGENDTLDFAQVERVREFILSGQTGKKIELPQKLIAEKGYNEVFFMPRDTDISGEEIPWDPRLVAVPGITELPQANVRVSAEILTAAQAGEKVFSASRWEAYMDWDKIEPPLVAAPRTEGCVFHPLGSPGRKSLKEFFIDAKVPGRERGKIPIISDRQGILWVAGHRMDERIKVTDSTQRVLRLQMMKTGNTG